MKIEWVLFAFGLANCDVGKRFDDGAGVDAGLDTTRSLQRVH